MPYLGHPRALHENNPVPIFFTAIELKSNRKAPLKVMLRSRDREGWRIKTRYRPFSGYDVPGRMMVLHGCKHSAKFWEILFSISKGSNNSRKLIYSSHNSILSWLSFLLMSGFRTPATFIYKCESI